MLYPKCPRCGGKSESVHEDEVPHGVAHAVHHAAKAFPIVAPLVVTTVAARAVWKRVPGGGMKRCTACGHEFR